MNDERSNFLELTKLAMEERRKELHTAIEKYGMSSKEASVAGTSFDQEFAEYLALTKGKQ